MTGQPQLPGGETEAHTTQGHDQVAVLSEMKSHYALHNEGSGASRILVEAQASGFEQGCGQHRGSLGMANGAASCIAQRMWTPYGELASRGIWTHRWAVGCKQAHGVLVSVLCCIQMGVA